MKTQKARNNFLEAKQDLSPRTLEQYSQALDYLTRECPKIPKKSEPIRSALNRVNKLWVRDAYWRVWKSFFRWCWWEYGIPNPMDRVQRPKPDEIEPRVLEPEELPLVLAAADNLRDKTILALALDSGVRASEFGRICTLDIGNDTIWLWGKGRKRLKVPISPETRRLLQLLIDQDGKRPQSPLFTGHNGQPISRFAVYRSVRRCMDRAGIVGPKRGSHCLRHSLATNFLADGGDVFILQRIMRHTDIGTTQKYVHLAMRTVVKRHHEHSPLRDALRGAQGALFSQDFDTHLAIKEAEKILERNRHD